MNYREHFHCAVPMCKGKDFAKKEEMIRHSKWHQKMDEALKYGFRRVTPMDDCSDQFQVPATPEPPDRLLLLFPILLFPIVLLLLLPIVLLLLPPHLLFRSAAITKSRPTTTASKVRAVTRYRQSRTSSRSSSLPPLPGVHQHLGRADALQLPPEGQRHPAGGLPQVQGG